MFNQFGRNSNDKKRDDVPPRIIFANLHPPSRPILTEAGYKVFSATAFSGWALIVFFVWIFRIEISLSKDLVTSLASSSVELAALSLAVLGILHELNKEDRWFKLGLFLVSILFAGVVFGGFFLALTWQKTFELPQQITIVFIAALGLIAIIQVDWKVRLRLTRLDWIANIVLPTKATAAIQQIRLTIPFVLPILLIWLPGLNRITAIVVLFGGALVTLVTLMGVTTFSLLKSQEEVQPEDPFIATLRAQYENENKSLVRLLELRTNIIDALNNLQADKIKAAVERDGSEQAPSMVERSYIFDRLRQMGIIEEKQVLESVLSSLVDERAICRESYSGPFWAIPDDDLINASLVQVQKLALVISHTWNRKGSFTVEGYSFEHLRDWLAVNVRIPAFVVGEYIVPRVLKRLLSEEYFHRIKKGAYSHIFVNKEFGISHSIWTHLLNNAKVEAKEEWEREEKRRRFDYRSMGRREKEEFTRKQTWNNFLNQLPHTQDGDDTVMTDDEIAILASILTK